MYVYMPKNERSVMHERIPSNDTTLRAARARRVPKLEIQESRVA